MKTIWQKKDSPVSENNWFWDFSTQEDRYYDQFLIPYELLSNLAHIRILIENQLLSQEEYDTLHSTLLDLFQNQNELKISDDDEDVHSFVEKRLTQDLGEIGKRIHTMRSRNDLILADTRLWGMDAINQMRVVVLQLLEAFQKQIQSNKVWFPGLTHTQLAMPQSTDSYFAGFAELLVAVEQGFDWAYSRLNVLPMGSAAGYGAPYFKIDLNRYAELLGFESTFVSVSYNQLSRGLEEQAVISVVNQLAKVLNRLASDIIFMASDVNGWITLSEEQVTGSSIMPQKKNPDAWELIRSETQRFMSAELELHQVSNNLISGYHRDLQRIKHIFMGNMMNMSKLMKIATEALNGVRFNKKNCQQAMKPALYATHLANRYVKEGLPFRDAYRKAAENYDKAEHQLSDDELAKSYVYPGTPNNIDIKKLKLKFEMISSKISTHEQKRKSVIETLINR